MLYADLRPSVVILTAERAENAEKLNGCPQES